MAVARAEQLELRGLRQRVGDHLREALAALLVAHNVHRRAGNLRGTLALSESLGDLLGAAERPALATASFIEAGKGKDAEKAAESSRAADLAPLLRVDGPRWQRAATYRVLQKVGRSMPEDLVAEWTPRMLEDVENGSPGGLGPDPAIQAVGALATCFLMVPENLQLQTLELLRQGLTLNPWVSRAVADALSGATRLGLSDETMPLVRGLLHESKLGVVKSHFIASLLPDQPEAESLVREAARGGDFDALEALAVADLIDDEQLVERCSERVRAAVENPDWTETTDNGITTISYGLLPDLAPLGIFGRFVAPDLRRRLVDSLLESLQDERLPPTNRYPAGDALFNLVPALEKTEAERCVEVVERLASAPVRNQGPWQEFTEDDPLAAMRFSLPIPEEVRGSALSALAQLVAEHDLATERVFEAITAAFDTGGPVAVAAALDAVSRHPELPPPVPLERLIRHPESRVRRAALKAMWNGDGRLPEGEALELVLADAEPGVRHLLCLLAEGPELRELRFSAASRMTRTCGCGRTRERARRAQVVRDGGDRLTRRASALSRATGVPEPGPPHVAAAFEPAVAVRVSKEDEGAHGNCCTSVTSDPALGQIGTRGLDVGVAPPVVLAATRLTALLLVVMVGVPSARATSRIACTLTGTPAQRRRSRHRGERRDLFWERQRRRLRPWWRRPRAPGDRATTASGR